MSSIQQMLAFAQTARHGSFAAAAREMGGAPSTLAKAVGRLEKALGVKLFHRTTRQVSLTPDGERLFRRCERVLVELEALQAEASGAQQALVGTLRVDMPVFYGKNILLPRLADWVQGYPELTLDVRLNDAPIDVIRDGVDLVVRIGALKDSSLIARQIDWQGLVLCASPNYLAARGVPKRIDELSGHSAVIFRMPGSGRRRPWQFRQRGNVLELHPNARIQVNETEGLLQAALLGLGLCQLPDYVVSEAIGRGTLLEVLPSSRPAKLPINLLYPGSRLLPARVRAAIEVILQK